MFAFSIIINTIRFPGSEDAAHQAEFRLIHFKFN